MENTGQTSPGGRIFAEAARRHKEGRNVRSQEKSILVFSGRNVFGKVTRFYDE